ncbi:MAG TPA: VWA domain-containing protein [Candidatus Acidoferrales bacterium]|nr:VWA domain-containing protein [Candidatus Acidoferrales bacterium]
MKPAVAVWLLAAVLGAQAPIRVNVNLVNVGFSVRDERGNLVTELNQEDFEVAEDGVPQHISFFARSGDVPLNLGLVMDISGSQQSFIKPHHKDLQVFLKTVLGKQDKAFLIAFANRIVLVSDYTGSIRDLMEGLDAFEHQRNHADYPIVGPSETRILGTAFYDAIYYSSTQMMQNIDRGRRALIVFSDGEDNSSAHHMLDAIEAAQANDVLLFTIRYTETRNGRLNARNKYGISVMERLARETGGSDFDGEGKGLNEGFRRIGEELRSSYELAYHTSNPPGDRTFHKIAIHCRRPGLTVRAKTGYYAR